MILLPPSSCPLSKPGHSPMPCEVSVCDPSLAAYLLSGIQQLLVCMLKYVGVNFKSLNCCSSTRHCQGSFVCLFVSLIL